MSILMHGRYPDGVLALMQPANWRPLVGAWLGFLCVMFFWYRNGLDFTLAGAMFRGEGFQWSLRSNFLASNIIHRAGGMVSKLAGLLVILRLIRLWFRGVGRQQLWPLIYLVSALLLATLTVITLKEVTNLDCPWALLRYGGSKPFVGLLEHRPAGIGGAVCFPSGHASAGYAWIALYYYFDIVRPKWKWVGLSLGLVTGLLFGISQQLRGAHFLSHDLWTLMICGTIAYALKLCLLTPRSAICTDLRRWPQKTGSGS